MDRIYEKKIVFFFSKVFLNTERGRDVFVVVFLRKGFDKIKQE